MVHRVIAASTTGSVCAMSSAPMRLGKSVEAVIVGGVSSHELGASEIGLSKYTCEWMQRHDTGGQQAQDRRATCKASTHGRQPRDSPSSCQPLTHRVMLGHAAAKATRRAER